MLTPECRKPLMAASKARISFFSLSSELRNKIYELALDIDDQNPNEIVVAHWRPQERHAGPRLPALLRTSVQVRNEAAPIYFGRNIFTMECNEQSAYMAEEWLAHLGQQNAALIKRFVVRIQTSFSDAIFARLLMNLCGSKLVTAGSALECLYLEPLKRGVLKEAVDVQLRNHHVRSRKDRDWEARGWVNLRWVVTKEDWNGTWVEGCLKNGWRYWVAIQGPVCKPEGLSTSERRREIEFKLDRYQDIKRAHLGKTLILEE